MAKGKEKLPPRFLTVKEVAVMLALSSKTVYKLIQKGLLRALAFGSALRIPVTEVEEYIGRSAKTGAKEPPREAPAPAERSGGGRGGDRRRQRRQPPRGFVCLPSD